MPKTDNKLTGKIGEDFAAAYLNSLNLIILERNFSSKFGEIDLIVQDGPTLVFVEVKTKVGDQFGSPEEMINKGKIAKVKRMAIFYLLDQGIKEPACRIDAVCIVLNSDHSLKSLHHYPSIT